MDSSDFTRKEFRATLRKIPTQVSIYDLPKGDPSWMKVLGQEFIVQGIEDPVFEFLEGSVVLSPGKVPLKRQVRNREGDILSEKEDLVVPRGFLGVLSEQTDDIPFKRDKTTGYDYTDAFRDASGRVLHTYLLPKKVLYRTQATALAISVRKMRSFFTLEIQTWNHGKLFLHIIPFNPNQKTTYDATIVLASKQGLDYEEETQAYLTTLYNIGVLPSPALLNIDGESLVIKEGTPGIEEYLGTSEVSLDEEASVRDAQRINLM